MEIVGFCVMLLVLLGGIVCYFGMCVKSNFDEASEAIGAIFGGVCAFGFSIFLIVVYAMRINELHDNNPPKTAEKPAAHQAVYTEFREGFGANSK